MAAQYRLSCLVSDPRSDAIPWEFIFEASGDRNAHTYSQRLLRVGLPPGITTVNLTARNTQRLVATYSLASPTVCARVYSNDVEIA